MKDKDEKKNDRLGDTDLSGSKDEEPKVYALKRDKGG